MIIEGIYRITNKVNNKIYIGSSRNLFGRWGSHVYNLVNGIHHSYKLQDDWNKYKFNNFAFDILEITNEEDNILEIEQKWLDKYKSYEDEIGYNICPCTDLNNIKNKKIKETMCEETNFDFCDKINSNIKEKLYINLNIFNNKKLNNIDKHYYSLSKAWFSKNPDKIDELKKAKYNYFKNYMNCYSEDCAWTTFLGFQNLLSSKGSIKGFVSLRGMIEDKRNVLCFMANCYENVVIRKIFEKEHNINHDDKKYALSILLNWIINVADIDKEIWIYLPSIRMRELLENWLEEGNKGDLEIE